MMTFVTADGRYTGRKLVLELRKYFNRIAMVAPGWDSSPIGNLIRQYGDIACIDIRHTKSRYINRDGQDGYRIGLIDTADNDCWVAYVVFDPTLGALLEVYQIDEHEKPLIRRRLSMRTNGELCLF